MVLLFAPMSALLPMILTRVPRSMCPNLMAGSCPTQTRNTMAVFWLTTKAGALSLITLTFTCSSKATMTSLTRSTELPRSISTRVVAASSWTTSKHHLASFLPLPTWSRFPLHNTHPPFFIKRAYTCLDIQCLLLLVVSIIYTMWQMQNLKQCKRQT